MKSSRIEIVLESDGSNYQEWKYDVEIYADLTVIRAEKVCRMLKKFENVFAVENWSAISELPPIDIDLLKEAVHLSCTLIKQSEKMSKWLKIKFRICCFFLPRSRTATRKANFRELNKFLKFHNYPLPVPEELIDEIAGD
jgi:hypothetical protein